MSLIETGANAIRPVGYESFPGTSKQSSPIDHRHPIEVENWKPFVLENTWVDYESDDWVPAEFLLDPMGFVHLHGAIKDGTTTDDTVLGTLPEGYRPKYVTPFLGYDEAHNIVVGHILTDGSVVGRNNLSAFFTTFSVIFEANRDVFVQTRS